MPDTNYTHFSVYIYLKNHKIFQKANDYVFYTVFCVYKKKRNKRTQAINKKFDMENSYKIAVFSDVVYSSVHKNVLGLSILIYNAHNLCF